MSIMTSESWACLDRISVTGEKLTSETAFLSSETVDKRPWLVSAFAALLQLQRNGRFEEGIGEFRVSDDTLNMAGRVLHCIHHRNLPTPFLSTLSGGGIQIAWASGQDAVEVSIFPGEGVTVARLEGDVPTKIIDLGPAEYGEINGFLEGFVV